MPANFCSITSFYRALVLAAAITSLSALSSTVAQGQQQQQQQATGTPDQLLNQQQIEQLVAPIALYPDALLAQVLTASTYPFEVALAARWSERNPNLKGEALEKAMQTQPWEPNVKGLTSVPQVLAMMNEKLEWTQQLGEAFLAQPDDVQNAIQALRAKAETTGNLKSSKEQRVRKLAATPRTGYVGPPEFIVIEPVEPDFIYVPIYDPVVVYGVGYWSPAYAPFFWYPPWWTVGPVYGFGPAFFVGPALWSSYNWGYAGFAAIGVSAVLYSRFNRRAPGLTTWSFDARHRRNIAFKNPKLQQQFGTGGSLKGASIKGSKTLDVKGPGSGSSRLTGPAAVKHLDSQRSRIKTTGGKSHAIKRSSVTRGPSVAKGASITRSQSVMRSPSVMRGPSVKSAPSAKGGRRH